ncbi:MAG TPA: glycerol-3-phosphate dehydrogenase/oxidase [Gemmatimonadaceae bacterium]|nr:glycerol-3-phosphate dehydrogenase/oxidase [Gemmatimonadaceae bacterium]
MQARTATRADRLAMLGSRTFDLLVVGGGITGCGIAREAALRGLSVALVEQDDFASGTSSRSSRLVHGGVRYLEHGHLNLVFESSRERRQLLEIAPHLVHPLEFVWPVYSGARISLWKLGAGLLLYDALSLFRNVARHHRLTPAEVLEKEPALEAAELVGGALYYDAATNDARLTLANAIGALEAGAVVLNHAAVTDLLMDGGRIAGATIQDRLAGSAVRVRASVVVNATGPWSDDVRSLETPGVPTVRGSKGSHIAVPRERVGNRNALTLLSPVDGRVLFALPAGANAIIGTTETDTTAPPGEVRASNEDVQYLLAAANAFFPAARLQPDDVVSAWAGIRPLLPIADDSAGAVTREHAISISAHGLVSIVGGKLTTYRVMARDVVAAVLRVLRGRRVRLKPSAQPLPGGAIASVDELVEEVARATSDGVLANHLATSFGSRWRDVWEEIERPSGRDRVVDNLPYTVGELRYSLQHEMAYTLGDVLIRRTHIAFETLDHGEAVAERLAALAAPIHGWDVAGARAAVLDYRREVTRMFSIDP